MENTVLRDNKRIAASWYAAARETHQQLLNILKAMEKATKLVKSKAKKIYIKDLIELIFMHPYCKIQLLERAGLAKRETASLYLRTLEEIGLLKAIKLSRENYYINRSLVKVLSQ